MESYPLTAAEVARRFGVHVQTVKRWVRDGHLRGMTTGGGHWRFSESDVEHFAAERMSREAAE